MALDAVSRKKKSGYNQMLSRLAYSEKSINVYVTLEYESAYEFKSRNDCISCDHSSTEKDREPGRAESWNRSQKEPKCRVACMQISR